MDKLLNLVVSLNPNLDSEEVESVKAEVRQEMQEIVKEQVQVELELIKKKVRKESKAELEESDSGSFVKAGKSQTDTEAFTESENEECEMGSVGETCPPSGDNVVNCDSDEGEDEGASRGMQCNKCSEWFSTNEFMRHYFVTHISENNEEIEETTSKEQTEETNSKEQSNLSPLSGGTATTVDIGIGDADEMDVDMRQEPKGDADSPSNMEPTDSNESNQSPMEVCGDEDGSGNVYKFKLCVPTLTSEGQLVAESGVMEKEFGVETSSGRASFLATLVKYQNTQEVQLEDEDKANYRRIKVLWLSLQISLVSKPNQISSFRLIIDAELINNESKRIRTIEKGVIVNFNENESGPKTAVTKLYKLMERKFTTLRLRECSANVRCKGPPEYHEGTDKGYQFGISVTAKSDITPRSGGGSSNSNANVEIASTSSDGKIHGPHTYTPSEFKLLSEKEQWRVSQLQYACKCNPQKRFFKKKDLQSHINYYTKEWKERCEECGRMFSHMKYLRAHINKKHNSKGKDRKRKAVFSTSVLKITKRRKRDGRKNDQKVPVNEHPHGDSPQNTDSARSLSNPNGRLKSRLDVATQLSQILSYSVPPSKNYRNAGTSKSSDGLQIVAILKVPNLPLDRPLETELIESAKALEFTKKVGEGQTKQLKFLLALVSHSSETPEEDGDKEEEIWLSLQLSILSPPASKFGIFTVNVEAELLDKMSRRKGNLLEWTPVRFSEGGETTKYVKRNIIQLKKDGKEVKLRVFLALAFPTEPSDSNESSQTN